MILHEFSIANNFSNYLQISLLIKGMVLHNIGDVNSAINKYKAAEEVNRIRKDLFVERAILNAFGNLYQESGKLDTALIYYRLLDFLSSYG